MKILILDVNYDHSSTGVIVKDLKIGLEGLGHQVLACYGRNVGSLKSSGIRVASSIEVNGHGILTRLTGMTGNFSPFATKKMLDIINAYRPDVVHLHELHGYYINWPAVVDYLKLKRIPTLWTFHCEFMYTGKCGYAYNCDQWESQCVRCPQLRDYPASLLFDRTREMFNDKKKILTNFDLLKIVTPSTWLADRVRRSFLKEKPISVIYNGIDTTNTFRPVNTSDLREKLGIKTRHVLVSIAPDLMSERKGGKWILDLAARLTNDDVTLVMVGVDDPSTVSLPNVIAVPRVGDKHLLAKYYSLGDYFLLTSKKETFSLVCAESLACGTPIIGFDAGAPTEVAPPGYGLFVEYGDIDGLYKSIKVSLQDRTGFKSREECAAYASRYFDKRKMVSAYEETYKSLMNL